MTARASDAWCWLLLWRLLIVLLIVLFTHSHCKPPFFQSNSNYSYSIYFWQYYFTEYEYIIQPTIQSKWNTNKYLVQPCPSILLGRLFWVDLIKCVSNVRPPVCTSVCPSVRPSTKSFFDFNEIWYVGRGRRVMHDGMQYDLIQGQGQGHEPFKVGNSTFFKGYLFHL